MKRFILVGNIDDIYAILKAMNEMRVFQKSRLFDVL